jgi:hypothetical protein
MRGERWALRAGESIVRLASRRLPPRARKERYQEWAAELPVILHDPEVRPAAHRLVRMLWFAADTLRGAPAAARAARHRGAHRGADEDARALAALAALPAVLAYQGYLVYTMIFGPALVYFAALWPLSMVGLIAQLARRRPGQAASRWWATGTLVAVTGGLTNTLASRVGWGHPLLFTVLGYCAVAISVLCVSVAVALFVRSRRRARVSG